MDLEWFKEHKVVSGLIILVLIFLFVDIILLSKLNEPIKTVVVNVCAHDTENIAYWSGNFVNLFSQPGGSRIVGKIPACSFEIVEVIKMEQSGGTEFYYVKWGNTAGWQTKRLLEGE